MVFLNRGDHFDALELPAEANSRPPSPWRWRLMEMDLKMYSQPEFLDTDPLVPRLDAGRGLLLAGDGNRPSASIPGQNRACCG